MHQTEHGFTLMELMYIVLIIGILSAIGIATYKGIKETSYEATVRQDVRSANLLCESYYIEYQSYIAFGPFTALQGSSNFAIAPGYILKISEGVTLKGILLPDRSLNIIGTHPGTAQGFQYIRRIGQ